MLVLNFDCLSPDLMGKIYPFHIGLILSVVDVQTWKYRPEEMCLFLTFVSSLMLVPKSMIYACRFVQNCAVYIICL